MSCCCCCLWLSASLVHRHDELPLRPGTQHIWRRALLLLFLQAAAVLLFAVHLLLVFLRHRQSFTADVADVGSCFAVLLWHSQYASSICCLQQLPLLLNSNLLLQPDRHLLLLLLKLL
jgi:hypothetical protein